MTRARAKLLQAKVNSLLSLCDFDTPLDGLLLHTHTLCIIRYEEKPPVAARRKRYYRLSRPVLPLQAVLPAPATGRSRKHHSTPQTQAVLPAQQLVLPLPKRYYRVLPLPKRYYRLRPVLPGAGPVLPVLTEPERLSSALCLVTLPIIYLFVPKLPLFCGWTIYSAHPLL